MTGEKVKLFCIIDGEYSAFPVKIPCDDTVGELKKAIKDEKPNDLQDLDADKLILWRVGVPDEGNPVNLENVETKTLLIKSTNEISEVFGPAPAKKTIHVIVQRPAAVPGATNSVHLAHGQQSFQLSPPSSRPGSPSQDLETTIRKITTRFFANDSPAAIFLTEYVKGARKLPLTTQGIKGLPRAWRRGKTTAPESRPNFLFLDLPAPSTDNIPERFRSNVILQELEKTESQDVPVFGVSGCGKTRSVVEMLCLQWGFYFNASDKDLGSDDLSSLAEFINKKTSEKQHPKENTIFAKNMTLLLFLSRILILNFCLSVPDCQETFSSASWAILQVCPTMFRDVFSALFKELFVRLNTLTIFELHLWTIVREEFMLVRERLAALGYPNFLSGSKLRLVVDEAQILGDRGINLFESSSTESELRPCLSPVLHGFRTPGDREELTIIYCGTGLSIRTLHWAQSSGDGVKEYGSKTFPYLEFPGWNGETSVQSFIDRVKDQLPDDESRRVIDTLLPPEAVKMLHERLTGRFRPIVTAIEGIIWTSDQKNWTSVIDNTETMLTSCKEQERRGNLIGELIRVESKIAKYPEQFASLSSIKETLGLFIYRWFILGETAVVLEDEAQLVEAAFGRIKMLGGNARTVLDEPFALRAAKNYFNQRDPLFIAAAKRAMLTSSNPSVHGSMWETMMPAVFVETFKNRPFSSWPLLPNDSIPEQLTGNVTIVGYNELEPRLAISHKDITTLAFMEAHIRGSSKQGDNTIPPFYFPAPHVSGPDVIFFVQINGEYFPVFTQLKLRQVLAGKDADEALATTSGQAVQAKMGKEQEKINKEQEKANKEQHKRQKKHKQPQTIACTESEKQPPPRLQDYCPSGIYISMVITYPAEVVSFQVMRPDPNPELEGLKRVIINVDDSNFAQIFPKSHVNFLDKLK
ncbi:hypothetical protein BGZ79_001448, partial [Entomortierella chlamydospora]